MDITQGVGATLGLPQPWPAVAGDQVLPVAFRPEHVLEEEEVEGGM